MHAVGYEYVSVMGNGLGSSFAPKPWWPSVFHQPSTVCAAHHFLQGDTFQTNMMIFNYQVGAVDSPISTPMSLPVDEDNSLPGITYVADTLAEVCGESRDLKIIVDGQQRW